MPHLTHLSHLDRDRHRKAGLDHLEGQPARDAKGDPIGKVSDALVEERTNRLRYLVVDADRWAAGKSVLIPVGLARVEDDAVYFDTLTREQVERLRPYRLGDEESVGALAENASILRGAPVKAPAAGERFDYETHEAEGGMFRTPARLRVVEERLEARHVPAGTDPEKAAKADRAKKGAMIAGPVAAAAGLAAFLLKKRQQNDQPEVVVRARPVPMRTAYSPIAAGLVKGSERAAKVSPPPQPVVMREELTTTPHLIATTHFKEEDMYQDRYMNRDEMRHDADRAAHEAADRASHEMHSASRSIGRRLRKDVHNEFDDVESTIRKALSDHDDHQHARMDALRRDLKKEIGRDLHGMLDDLSKSIAARPKRMDKRMSSLRNDLMKEIRHELKDMLGGTRKSLMSRQEKHEDSIEHLHEHAKNQQELLEDMNHQLEKVRRELRSQRGGFPWMLVLLGAAGYYLYRNPEARHKLQDRAQQVIEQNPQLKEAAQHSKEALQQGVQRVQQGESPLRVAKDTANEVKGDAQTAAQTAKEEAKETADKAKDQAKMAADKAKDQAKDVASKSVSNTSGMGDTPRATDAMRGNEGNNRR